VLESVVSNAERRALVNGEAAAVPRVSDVYASLPSLTGKIELEYEGELKGAEPVARELVRQAVATVFDGYAPKSDLRPVIEWFEGGGTLDLSDLTSAPAFLAAVSPVTGLDRVARAMGGGLGDSDEVRASVADFVLEGLCALKKISRNDEGRLFSSPPAARSRAEVRQVEQMMEEEEPTVKGKKKYYN